MLNNSRNRELEAIICYIMYIYCSILLYFNIKLYFILIGNDWKNPILFTYCFYTINRNSRKHETYTININVIPQIDTFKHDIWTEILLKQQKAFSSFFSFDTSHSWPLIVLNLSRWLNQRAKEFGIHF